jgi:hypothetical protein
MGIVSCEELPKGRTLSGKSQETDAYTRSFLVRVDALDESLIDISNAPGISVKESDAHPENASIVALEYDVKCVHDSGLLWQVDFKYYAKPVDLNDGLSAPGAIEGFGKKPVWSAGSSVTTGPVTKDIYDGKITNSAGDPLEDAVKEYAEFRCSVTMYSFSVSGWASTALEYTNATNSDSWNGGGPRTWKCQGCSAQLVTESLNGVSFTLWEVAWEFAYRKDTWDLVLLDIGYNQRVNEDGEPSQSGDKKKTIVGPDKKPLAGPVGLNNGVAVSPGDEPDEREFIVYEQRPFGTVFGEITP